MNWSTGKAAACLVVLAVALARSPLLAQTGPCASSAAELARSVIGATAPVTTVAQQQAYGKVVAALRRGDVQAARAAFAALVKTNPALGRPPALCRLLHAVAREGVLGQDARALAAFRAVAVPGDTGGKSGGAQSDQQRAVQTITSIQKQMYEDAVKILDNLKS